MSTVNWLVDTNSVFYFQGQQAKRHKILGNQGLGILIVQISEILGSKKMGKAEETQLRNIISLGTILPVEEPIAYQAANLRRHFSLQTIDSLIAATAIEYDLTLVSADKDFPRIPGLKWVNPLG